MIRWLFRSGYYLFLNIEERLPLIKISRKTKVTFAHAHNMFNLMGKAELFHIERLDGRSNKYVFTEKGKEVRKHFECLKELFKEDDEK